MRLVFIRVDIAGHSLKPIAQSTEDRRASVLPEFVIFGEEKNLITVREGKLRLWFNQFFQRNDPQKDIICENVCSVDPILWIANNWTNNNVFWGFFFNSMIHSKVFFKWSNKTCNNILMLWFPVKFYSSKEIPMIKSPFTIVPSILVCFFFLCKLYIRFYIKRREMLYANFT